MFDVGFSEIFVIALVALIVIGPERLPKVARTLGHLFGRMQRYVNDVKADITREMELDELRKLQSTVEEAARSIEHSVTHEIKSAESQLNSIAATAADAVPASTDITTPTAIASASPPQAAATEPAPAAPAPAPQLELGLEAPGEAKRKQE
jgi:sec-independent protein translocase protein TatB